MGGEGLTPEFAWKSELSRSLAGLRARSRQDLDVTTRLRLLVFVGFVVFGSYAQASTPVEEYFPLVAGSEYAYHGTFKDKQYTNQLVVRSSKLQRGPKVFYFTEKADDPSNGSTGIGSLSFGLGGYFYRKGNLYTLDAFFLREVPALDPSRAQLLLGRDWALGSAHDITGSFPIKVVMEGYDDVRVPAGQFRS